MAVSTQPAPSQSPRDGAARRGHHPGLALAVIAGTQLMVVLDATIVNIALPHIQTALHFKLTNLAWVLNAYTLTFGGLLLLGGRAGDILGRRRVLVFGILLFAVASALGGFATSSGWLLACRALQGVGGAIASPTSLALITTNFAEGPERNRAFGVFAAVSGSGAAIGLLAGGMLTSWLSWRWVLFVNVPIGILLALAAPLFINESERHPGTFDISGALTSTAGMSALVYGFINAGQNGWSDTWTLVSFVVAVVLLAIFVFIERAQADPITPLAMFRNRNRSGSYGIMLTLAAAMFGMFFFLTLFVQDILGYSPLKSGFAFLPVSAVIIVVAQVTAKQLIKVGPRPFMIGGSVLAAGGLLWLAQISASSTYVSGVLPPMLVFAAGMGSLFVPLTVTAVAGVEAHESGAASSLLNVSQMVGGSLGLSILVTVFGTAQRHEFAHHASKQVALAHSISSSFLMAVVFAFIALVISAVAIRASAKDVDMSSLPGMG